MTRIIIQDRDEDGCHLAPREANTTRVGAVDPFVWTLPRRAKRSLQNFQLSSVVFLEQWIHRSASSSSKHFLQVSALATAVPGAVPSSTACNARRVPIISFVGIVEPLEDR